MVMVLLLVIGVAVIVLAGVAVARPFRREGSSWRSAGYVGGAGGCSTGRDESSGSSGESGSGDSGGGCGGGGCGGGS